MTKYDGPIIEVHIDKYAPNSIHAKQFNGDGCFSVGQKLHLQKGIISTLTEVAIKECFIVLKDRRKTWILVVTDAVEG